MANFPIAENSAWFRPRGDFFGELRPLLRPKKAKKVYRKWSGFEAGMATPSDRGSWTVGQKRKNLSRSEEFPRRPEARTRKFFDRERFASPLTTGRRIARTSLPYAILRR
jgi:hypothetical protein